MTELLTGTVTFLFTDIEGSTQLLKRLGKTYGQALADHREILRAAVRQHGGDEVDRQGDSFLFAFPRADEAAAAAIDGQQGLEAHKWPAGARLRVRMGIHTAEPTVSEEGYYGLGVHRAARIMSAAHGGQVLSPPYSRMPSCREASFATSGSTGSRTSIGPSASTNLTCRA